MPHRPTPGASEALIAILRISAKLGALASGLSGFYIAYAIFTLKKRFNSYELSPADITQDRMYQVMAAVLVIVLLALATPKYDRTKPEDDAPAPPGPDPKKSNAMTGMRLPPPPTGRPDMIEPYRPPPPPAPRPMSLNRGGAEGSVPASASGGGGPEITGQKSYPVQQNWAVKHFQETWPSNPAANQGGPNARPHDAPTSNVRPSVPQSPLGPPPGPTSPKPGEVPLKAFTASELALTSRELSTSAPTRLTPPAAQRPNANTAAALPPPAATPPQGYVPVQPGYAAPTGYAPPPAPPPPGYVPSQPGYGQPVGAVAPGYAPASAGYGQPMPQAPIPGYVAPATGSYAPVVAGQPMPQTPPPGYGPPPGGGYAPAPQGYPRPEYPRQDYPRQDYPAPGQPMQQPGYGAVHGQPMSPQPMPPQPGGYAPQPGYGAPQPGYGAAQPMPPQGSPQPSYPPRQPNYPAPRGPVPGYAGGGMPGEGGVPPTPAMGGRGAAGLPSPSLPNYGNGGYGQRPQFNQHDPRLPKFLWRCGNCGAMTQTNERLAQGPRCETCGSYNTELESSL